MIDTSIDFDHDDPIRLIAEVIVTHDEGPRGARINAEQWDAEVRGNMQLAYEIHTRLQVFYVALQSRSSTVQ
jgi:hypothetical protein